MKNSDRVNGAAVTPGVELPLEQLNGEQKSLLVALVDAHHGWVRRVCRSILNNPADVEDVVQETFLKVLLHIHQLKNPESVRAWLSRIVVNEARTRMRRNNREKPIEPPRKQESSDDQEDVDLQLFVDLRPLPSKVLERQELCDVLNLVISTLPAQYREIFVLKELQGLSNAAISERAGISTAAVISRVHRARLRVKREMAAVFSSSTRGLTANSKSSLQNGKGPNEPNSGRAPGSRKGVRNSNRGRNDERTDG